MENFQFHLILLGAEINCFYESKTYPYRLSRYSFQLVCTQPPLDSNTSVPPPLTTYQEPSLLSDLMYNIGCPNTFCKYFFRSLIFILIVCFLLVFRWIRLIYPNKDGDFREIKSPDILSKVVGREKD